MAAPQSIGPETQILDVNGYDWSWVFAIFREIRGFTGYWVGSNGSLWSYRDNSGRAKSRLRLLTPSPMRGGHLKKSLTDDSGIRRHLYIHRLVLEAFVGPCPTGKECRHLDGNPANNDVRNLAWGTKAENINDRDIVHRTTARGERCHGTHLGTKDIEDIYNRCESGEYVKDIAASYGIDPSSCAKILKGVYWSHAVPGRKPPLRDVDARPRGARHPAATGRRRSPSGEEHHNSKLTDADAGVIRRLYADGGISQRAIALRFGVSQCTIRYVIIGKTYGCVNANS